MELSCSSRKIILKGKGSKDLNLVEGTAYRLELLSKDYDLSGDFEL